MWQAPLGWECCMLKTEQVTQQVSNLKLTSVRP